MRAVDLFIYPVKGSRAVAVAEAIVEARGFVGDRRWMLVDETGRAVTQRDAPSLARLEASPQADGRLLLGFDGEALEVRRPDPGTACTPVDIWRDALDLPEAVEAAPTLRRWFKRAFRLVWHPDGVRRPVDAAWSGGAEVSLADGFPILIATTESLRAVGTPFGMDRFRPNIVVEGAAPWAEDGWRRVRVGTVELDLVKPCARCVVTTVDQATGVVSGAEPLEILRRLRFSADRRNVGVLFGVNAVPVGTGTVRRGDPVQVVAEGAPWPIRPARAEGPIADPPIG